MLGKAIMAMALIIAFASSAIASPEVAVLGELTKVSGSSPFQPGGTYECSLDDAYRDLESETHIAVDPADARRIAVAWPQDNSLGVVVASSQDGGETWTRTVVEGFTVCSSSDSNKNRVSHPRLAFSSNGRLYLAAFPVGEWDYNPARNIQNEILVAHSDDGGVEWSAPRPITTSQVLNDFDGMVVEPDSGAVDVIWTENELVESATIGEPIYLSRSTDGGETWTKNLVRRATPGSIAFTTVAPLPHGDLVVFSQEVPIPNFAPPGSPHGPILVLTSSTKGETWSQPVKLVEDAVNGWPSVAVTQKGTIYLAYRTGSSQDGFTVWLIRSDDGGGTWTDPIEALNYRYNNGIYPFINLAVTGEQTVALLYYSTTTDPDEPHRANIAVSPDCGHTWESSGIGERFTTADLGFAQGLTAMPNGFLVSVSLGGEEGVVGPTDVFFTSVVSRGARASSCSTRT